MGAFFTFHNNWRELFFCRVAPLILFSPIIIRALMSGQGLIKNGGFLIFVCGLFGAIVVPTLYLSSASVCVDDEEIFKRLFWVKLKSIKWSEIGAVCLETRYTRNGPYRMCAVYKAPFVRPTVSPFKAGSLAIEFNASIGKFETLSNLIGQQAKSRSFPMFKSDTKVTETLQEPNGAYSLFPKLEQVDVLQARKSFAN